MRPYVDGDRVRVVVHATGDNGLYGVGYGATGTVQDVDDRDNAPDLSVCVLLDGDDMPIWFTTGEIELL